METVGKERFLEVNGKLYPKQYSFRFTEENVPKIAQFPHSRGKAFLKKSYGTLSCSERDTFPVQFGKRSYFLYPTGTMYTGSMPSGRPRSFVTLPSSKAPTGTDASPNATA